MSDEKPKIIVDEDWKSQIQREREVDEANRKTNDSEVPQDDTGALPGGVTPEATFESLVATFVTQAMFALGVVHDPQAQEVMVNLDEAKFVIDNLGILCEKTEGNLTTEESTHLQQMLDELQRAYVARVQQFQQQAMQEGPIHPLNQG